MNDLRMTALKMLFPEKTVSDPLNKFIEEIANENLDKMSFQREFVEAEECRPTFDQISNERIIDELNKDIGTLKTFENVLQERSQSLSVYVNSMSKIKPPAETLLYPDATLNSSINMMFNFLEQESALGKQQIYLNEMRKEMNELRHEAKNRLAEYQRDIANADREMNNAERKLAKSKELYEKYLKIKLRNLTPDAPEGSPRNSRKGTNSSRNSMSRKSRTDSAVLKELDEALYKTERELKDDINSLIRIISSRDQVISASRRAYQKLDRDCKKSLSLMLTKFVAREKEAEASRRATLEQLERTVLELDVDADVTEFVLRNRDTDISDSLILSSQALSILNDLCPPPSSTVTIANELAKRASRRVINETANGSNKRTDSPASIRDSMSSIASGRNDVVTPISTPYPTGIIGSSTNNTTNIQPPSSSSLSSSSRWDNIVSQYFSLSNNQSSQDNSRPNSPYISNQDSQMNEGQSSSSLQSQTACDQDSYVSPSKRLTMRLEEEIHTYTRSRSSSSTISMKDSPDTDKPNSLSAVSALSPTPPLASENGGLSISNESPNISTLHQMNFPSSSRTQNKRLSAIESHLSAIFYKKKVTETQDNISIKDYLNNHVNDLSQIFESSEGRRDFALILNQYRSKQVALTDGFQPLGVVLLKCLDLCLLNNDIHTAKVIMMLSLTFYLQTGGSSVAQDKLSPREKSDHHPLDGVDRDSTSSTLFSSDVRRSRESSGDGNSDARSKRVYLKELLLSHPIWKDKSFWEQTLWDCILEQLKTIPYEGNWYSLEREERHMVVRRVHDVVFSQVMAIMHSMLELGCAVRDAREFLFRVCTIHQLGERYRQELLTHLHIVTKSRAIKYDTLKVGEATL